MGFIGLFLSWRFVLRRQFQNHAELVYQMQNKSKRPPATLRKNPFASVQDALGAVSQGKWKQLAAFAECRLQWLRQNTRMADYVAGIVGLAIWTA